MAVGEIAYEIGGWARGSFPSSGGGGGSAGQGYSRAVLRWWQCASSCAIAGINPPITTCSSSCERKLQLSSLHTGGGHVLLVDGHVKFLNDTVDRAIQKGLMTRRGAETLADF